MWWFKKKSKDVMHLEDLPNQAMKKLIFPDPLQQAEYNEFGSTEKNIHEHSEIQRKWIEQIGKKKN